MKGIKGSAESGPDGDACRSIREGTGWELKFFFSFIALRKTERTMDMDFLWSWAMLALVTLISVLYLFHSLPCLVNVRSLEKEFLFWGLSVFL